MNKIFSVLYFSGISLLKRRIEGVGSEKDHEKSVVPDLYGNNLPFGLTRYGSEINPKDILRYSRLIGMEPKNIFCPLFI
jgi:hypothetical protein